MEFPLQDEKLAETIFSGRMTFLWFCFAKMGAAFFATQFNFYDSEAEALGSCQARRLLISFPCCWELSLQVLEFLFTCFQQEMLVVPAV